MQFTTLAAVALLDVAQAAEVHVVNVGKDPMSNQTAQKFFPDKLEAKAGDMVQFQFWAGNHTATQSTFDNACVPISRSNRSAVGISSGFQPAAAAEAMGQVPVFTVMINGTSPKWFYCAQGKHCQDGMSLVINKNPSANSTRTLENYKQLAARAQGTEGGEGGRTGTEPTRGASNSNFVAAPATMLLVLGSAFMLL